MSTVFFQFDLGTRAFILVVRYKYIMFWSTKGQPRESNKPVQFHNFMSEKNYIINTKYIGKIESILVLISYTKILTRLKSLKIYL